MEAKRLHGDVELGSGEVEHGTEIIKCTVSPGFALGGGKDAHSRPLRIRSSDFAEAAGVEV